MRLQSHYLIPLALVGAAAGLFPLATGAVDQRPAAEPLPPQIETFEAAPRNEITPAQMAVPERNMCGERSEIVAMLKQDFDEAPTALGMVDQRSVVEVFVSSSGTWTILATGTDGNSCIVSAGEGWQNAGPMLAGERA